LAKIEAARLAHDEGIEITIGVIGGWKIL